MQFNAKRFAKVTGPERATRKNEVWSVELVLLDIARRPILLVALDVFSRIPVVLDQTSGKAGDIALKLDSASRRSGYPERLWLDHANEFRSKELGAWADLRPRRHDQDHDSSKKTPPQRGP